MFVLESGTKVHKVELRDVDDQVERFRNTAVVAYSKFEICICQKKLRKTLNTVRLCGDPTKI